MSIKFDMKIDGDTLFVEAIGTDDDLEDVLKYGTAVIKEAILNKTPKVICDERELEYRIGTFDLYELAEKYAELAPHLAKVAIVCQSECYPDAKFWEDVSANKGLSFRVFTSMPSAREWIEK
ncbi:MAG: hypothetical protein ACLFQX_12135 [Candidatus Kapaibacterium sp.]